ncbi:Protein kinase domain [Carpediemonas membranifera]|uniref:non-specific serine/threonine protein kinase n=1 Tax=Carpediemonas membranifera TaxID=201153 RepID=A0A8J6B8T6_9EUKA|nr:Protein kinase domain [Carpediemonas membranifera]|eukprot:KAG9395564.1 Protein kinase domain [Carpediemonas membranifera]
MIMSLCGTNLGVLRKSRPEQRFSLSTTLKLGVSMTSCIRDVHAAGYVHRDVKPSNFVLGHNNNRVYIIDFGLSRRNVDDAGQLLPERECPGFRGTARYASVASHQCKDLAPRDDYWLKDRDRIGEAKSRCTTHDTLTSGLPGCFEKLLTYIKSLDFTDRVDHGKVQAMFLDEMRARGLSPGAEYDWCCDSQPALYRPTTSLYAAHGMGQPPLSSSFPETRRPSRPSTLSHVQLPSVSTPAEAVPLITSRTGDSTRTRSFARLPSLDRGWVRGSSGGHGSDSPATVDSPPSVPPSPLKALCSSRGGLESTRTHSVWHPQAHRSRF